MKTSFLPVAMAPVPLLSTSFLLVNIFALIFLYFPSILNTKTKYILFVMTASGSFNVKSLFKNNNVNNNNKKNVTKIKFMIHITQIQIYFARES